MIFKLLAGIPNVALLVRPMVHIHKDMRIKHTRNRNKISVRDIRIR